jgi:hypothetical protein
VHGADADHEQRERPEEEPCLDGVEDGRAGGALVRTAATERVVAVERGAERHEEQRERDRHGREAEQVARAAVRAQPAGEARPEVDDPAHEEVGRDPVARAGHDRPHGEE